LHLLARARAHTTRAMSGTARVCGGADGEDLGGDVHVARIGASVQQQLDHDRVAIEGGRRERSQAVIVFLCLVWL
jgi:hypothetical protein